MTAPSSEAEVARRAGRRVAGDTIDGEERVRVRLPCPRHVRARWGKVLGGAGHPEKAPFWLLVARLRTVRALVARGEPEPLPGVVAQAGEAQVVVVAAAEEGAGERAEDPPGAGLLADQAAEVAVEHEGAVARPEPAGGLEREDVRGNDVRVHGPGSRASLHDEANNRRKPPPLSSPSLAF